MKLTTTLVVASLLLVGCSREPELTSGTVVGKRHEPEKRWVQIILMPRITRVGKTSVTSFTPIPIFHHRPEHWTLVLQGTIEVGGERRQKQREIYVPRATYDAVPVGAAYTIQVADKTELPVEKRRASEKEKLAYGVQPADSR